MLKKVPHNDYHVPTDTCLNSSHERCCRTPVAISSFDSLMIVISLFCVTRHIQDLCIYYMMSYSPIIRRSWTDRLLTKICSWVSLRLFFLNDLLKGAVCSDNIHMITNGNVQFFHPSQIFARNVDLSNITLTSCPPHTVYADWCRSPKTNQRQVFQKAIILCAVK